MANPNSKNWLLTRDQDIILIDQQDLIKVGDFKEKLRQSFQYSVVDQVLLYGLFLLRIDRPNSFFYGKFSQVD